MTITEKS